MGDKSNALTFRQQIEIREDGRCAVTRLRQQLVASHLIPKRMGTEGVKSVVADFVGEQETHYAHKFHEMIGILLIGTLDVEVDRYMLDFFHVAVSNEYIYSTILLLTESTKGDTYALHHFDTTQNLNFLGYDFDVQPFSDLSLPPLHLHQVTLSSHGGNVILPPNGVFNWHYLQCVAKQFATSEYKSIISKLWKVL